MKKQQKWGLATGIMDKCLCFLQFLILLVWWHETTKMWQPYKKSSTTFFSRTNMVEQGNGGTSWPRFTCKTATMKSICIRSLRINSVFVHKMYRKVASVANKPDENYKVKKDHHSVTTSTYRDNNWFFIFSSLSSRHNWARDLRRNGQRTEWCVNEEAVGRSFGSMFAISCTAVTKLKFETKPNKCTGLGQHNGVCMFRHIGASHGWVSLRIYQMGQTNACQWSHEIRH